MFKSLKIPNRLSLFSTACLFLSGHALAAQPGIPVADMSAAGMFSAADMIVKSVITGLILASLLTWVVLLVKGSALWQAKREALRANHLLNQSASLADAIQRSASGSGYSLAQCLLQDIQQELTLSRDSSNTETLKERAGFRQEQLLALKARQMTQGIGILATIGSVSPFVGLFGTVWGIMNSFIGIAASKSTNLATVAPGIAEALLATAAGLVAAIPAVVIYNLFSRNINHYKAQLRAASSLALLMLSRDLDTGLIEGVLSRPQE